MISELSTSSSKQLSDKHQQAIRKGLRSGFLTLDEKMKTQPTLHGDNERSGTTAICALITADFLFIANLGDSRAVMSKGGQTSFGTEDHKPFLPKVCHLF